MPRSRRRSSISSRQTRSIAGASVSAYSAATRSSTSLIATTAAGSVARVTGKRVLGLEPRGRTRPGRDGTGCRASADPCGRAARARPTAPADESSRAGTGTDNVAKRCSADSEYGRSASRCACERCPDAGRDWHQTVARRPGGAAARPPADDRAAQRLVQPEQVVGVALDRRGIPRVEQRLQRREVVLEVVDRAVGIGWRRPRQARAGLLAPRRPPAPGGRERVPVIARMTSSA